MKNEKNYYLGLDVGTDSVGYAATDTSTEFRLIKYRGEPVWGVSVFEEAGRAADRRAFRTGRRRIDRRKQRVRFVQELFAKEIEKKDENFYRRITESGLIRGDGVEPYCLFNDADFSDADYHEKYPTIHHLICELMESKEPHDVRLVYIACAYLVVHRGHFLSEVSVDNVEKMFEFEPVYNDFLDYCREYSDEEGYLEPWSTSKETKENFAKTLKMHGVQNKKQAFRNLLFGGKKAPKKIKTDDGEFPFSVDGILTLLTGGKTSLAELYGNDEYAEIGSFSLDAKEEDYCAVLARLGDDGELIRKLKALYDWAVLADLCGGKQYISQAKVAVYEQHKHDLALLKKFVKENYPLETYRKVFRKIEENNYVAYSGNTKSVKESLDTYKKCASRADFCMFIKNTLELAKPENSEKLPADMLERINNGDFMPKQVTGENRVLPYQLYYVELSQILKTASAYLPFLIETDENGCRTDKKLLSIMTYRVPYYVGPLNPKGEHSWVARRAAGKVYPWNFDDMVDRDKSEENFIARMTNTCTYLAGEDVLPQNSLLYQKFVVLNEINKLKIRNVSIGNELKQKIYDELFAFKKKVTYRSLVSYLCRNGVSREDSETLSGVDDTIEGTLSSRIAFKSLIEKEQLSDSAVENIIRRRAYCEDKNRFKAWLGGNYPQISDEDKRYITALSLKGFGRLSERLLSGIEGIDKETGEVNTVIGFMWEKTVALSELLLSERYTFGEVIKQENAEYYGQNPRTLNERLDEMYASNTVKRAIIRTLEIVSDVVKATGKAPEKIFVEMARGAKDDEKHKRTKSRKEKLLEYYDKIKSEEVVKLRGMIESYGDRADNKLQSDRLYLYFMQLGKCMYTGEPIEIEQLTSRRYDIDHIYPRSHIPEDGVLNDKVLVCSIANEKKSNVYPIAADVRMRMTGFWKKLCDNGLITEEKYKRLVRATPLTAEEEWGFVNRQLVETRQSTKIITALLSERYPNTEIVFVKAKHASEFRHEYDILKSRAINDLHHAKDAYLNVVCGMVYHSVFTKQWFLLNRENKDYTINMRVLFGRKQFVNGEKIWDGAASLAAVKQTVRKNNCHLTVYAFCRRGGFFDQQPKKKAEGLVPRKANLPTEKYGGYQKTTATFFALALCKFGGKRDVLILPVELLVAERFQSDEKFAKEYLLSVAEGLLGKKVDEIAFPLGKRVLKINTVFEADGFRMCLGGKAGGGKQLGMKPIMSLILSPELETYIKKLESFNEKQKKNGNIIYDPEYEIVNSDKNRELYRLLADKLSKKPFALRPSVEAKRIADKEEEFTKLPVKEQAQTLLNLVSLFARSANKDTLTGISGVCFMSFRLSNWKKNYNSVRIVDSSASGVRESKSENLLSLL